jgi:cytochrome oxidase Cu insertion factor (SCO1/SenC/PrrC family)
MLRAVLMLVALLVLLLIGAVWLGLVDLNQTQNAQAPKFEMKVNTPTVGTTTTNVQVPVVKTETRQVEVPSVSVGGGETANQQ